MDKRKQEARTRADNAFKRHAPFSTESNNAQASYKEAEKSYLFLADRLTAVELDELRFMLDSLVDRHRA